MHRHPFPDDASLQATLPVNTGFGVERLETFLHQAGQRYVRPLVSASEYDALLDTQASNSLSAAQTALLPYVQRAVGLRALHLGVDQLNLQITNGSIRAEETEMGRAPKQWELKGLKASYAQQALQAEDELLEYLQAEQANFPGWVGSAGDTQHRDGLIPTAAIFDRHLSISGNVGLFRRLKPHLSEAETFYLAPIFGDTFAALKNKVKAGGTLSETEAAQLNLARPALARLAMAAALHVLPIQVDETGAYGYQVDSAGTIEGKESLADKTQSRAIHYLKETAQVYLGKLDTLINPPADTDTPGPYDTPDDSAIYFAL